MSFASDALRDEAARFRRMKLLISDARTLQVLEEYAAELDARADRMDTETEPTPPGSPLTARPATERSLSPRFSDRRPPLRT